MLRSLIGRGAVALAIAGCLLVSHAQAGGLPGDLDEDGLVGIQDLFALFGVWGECPQPCPPSCFGDFDGDCGVGITDLFIMFGNWGEEVAGACCFNGEGSCAFIRETLCDGEEKYLPDLRHLL